MNLDTRGGEAARALRATTYRGATAVDTAAALTALRRIHRRRATVRSAAAAGAVALAVTAVTGLQLSGVLQHTSGESASAPVLPALGSGYDVIATSVSPDGTAEAVATYRDGQTAVVLVRTPASGSTEVVWSAPTAHERGSGTTSFPAAVGWAPDGSRLAVLVGQERPHRATGPTRVDLTLLAMDPDGTARHTVAVVGTCQCSGALPTLAWSADRVAIDIPDGPDHGLHTEEIR